MPKLFSFNLSKKNASNKSSEYNYNYNYSYDSEQYAKSGQSSDQRKVPFSIVESYKTIRTNLMFLLSQKGGKVVVVSSSDAGEGKSTTAINVAIAFSQLDNKVLLIDADLRRSTIHKKIKLQNTNGLSHVIAGFSTFEEAVASFNANLDVLVAGPIPPNPSELLGSHTFEVLLENLKEKYDYIIIDTPPINVVSDSLVLAPKTDGLVLVFRDTVTPYDSFNRALAAAEFAGIPVLGAIMNGANPKSKRGYTYRKYYSSPRYSSRRYGYNYSYDRTNLDKR